MIFGRRELRHETESSQAQPQPTIRLAADEPKLNVAKASVPLLPIVLLSVDAMAGPYSVGRFLVGPGRILAAMLIGVAAAGLDEPQQDGRAWRQPFLTARVMGIPTSSR